MSDCLFCKILNGEIPSKKVYENEWVYCFEDINPEAPVHVLLIPKQHISSANELNGENSWFVSKIFEAAVTVARQLGIADNGYRIINNCGVDGGQTVGHLHFHMLAGRNLGWPPG